MTIQLKVPSIACDGCAEAITTALKADQPDATVTVDVDTKIVSVETSASIAAVKQTITAAGHTVAPE